jgi:hypothetical protein
MTDAGIFALADTHGWQDDFGRWNFKDDGLLGFVHAIEKAEREAKNPVLDSSYPDGDGYWHDTKENVA